MGEERNGPCFTIWGRCTLTLKEMVDITIRIQEIRVNETDEMQTTSSSLQDRLSDRLKSPLSVAKALKTAT
jgi:hypothetical protein